MIPMSKISNKIRNTRIISRFLEGETLTAIGLCYGLSRQRIFQILKKHEVNPAIGGSALKRQNKGLAKNRIRAEKTSNAYGITRAALTLIPIEARQAYSSQRRSVSISNTGWNFNLETWWNLWLQSGSFAQRGPRCGQFQMRRRNPDAHWEPANVFIKKLGAR